MIASYITARREGFAKAAFEAREHAFGLPPLAEEPMRKVRMHQAVITPRRNGVGMAPRIDRNRRGAHAEFASAEHMKRLAVVSGVGIDAADVQEGCGLTNRRFEPRRIVARTERQIHAGDQVCGVVASGGQFRKRTGLPATAPSLEEVGADMTAFKSGGIDADVGRTGDQAASVRASENSAEQVVESPPFRS